MKSTTKSTTKSTRTVTLDAAPVHEPETETSPFPDDLPADHDAAQEAGLCPVCRDLLAWHEQPCEVTPAPPAAAHPPADAPTLPPPAPVSTFAFAIGHRVQPAASAPAAVTWRGQHKEHHPDTGLVHRINVYHLDNGYWDCYREEELQAA